jgi:predicted DNA-binding transcriptional regulator AlpA
MIALPIQEAIMHEYFLRNLAELAEKRAVIIRDEARLWDILARDLKREAGRLGDAQSTRRIIPARLDPPPPQSTAPNQTKLFVRIPEAARMMGIGRSSLYKEISASRLNVRKAGRKTLIAVADIQTWFANLPDERS